MLLYFGIARAYRDTACLCGRNGAYQSLVGEFRAHYAGFFDPGFGGTEGANAVLEVRSLEIPFALRHGQLIGHLNYMPLAGAPKTLYGADKKSHYQGQALKLSKYFKDQ